MRCKKLSAVLFAIVVLISSCGKMPQYTIKTPKQVTDTASYYEGQLVVLADEYKQNKEYSYSSVKPQYISDDYIAVAVYASGFSSDGTSILLSLIELYDYSGKLIKRIDLNELEEGRQYISECMGKDERGISIILSDDSSSIISKYILNVDTLEINKEQEFSKTSFMPGVSPKKVFDTGDGYFVLYDWLDGNNYKTNIAKISDFEIVYDIRIECNGSVINADLNEEHLIYQEEMGAYYSLDLASGKSTKIEMTDEQLSLYKSSGTVYGNKIITKTGTEIRQYDIDDNKETVIQDLNYTDYNLYSLCDGWLTYISSEKTVILDLSASGNEVGGRCKLIVLQKAKTNPHIGKKIIEIAPIWGMYPIIGESQRIFNLTNNDYFAYVSTRYDIEHFELPDYYQTNSSLTDTVTLVTNQLAVDIRNGIGPDIVIGLGDTTQLNAEEFLIDLYPYIDGKEGIKRADYFENALDAFATAGKLYQIPLTMNVLGIVTDKNNVPIGKKGFTFEEYQEFISSKCSGFDPISIGNNREQYFRFLFCSMKDSFVAQDSIKIDTNEFRALAEYSKNNISEEAYTSSQDNLETKWVILNDIYYDLINTVDFTSEVDIYGAPSFDGRGPMISVFNTIAITSCSSDIDAAWAFLRTAIGYEAQKTLTNANPINRLAFADYAKVAVKEANKTFKKMYISKELNEKDIERYIQMLEKAEYSTSYDMQIYQVIIEELEPYYKDEKSINSTIEIIENRCQTIINER